MDAEIGLWRSTLGETHPHFGFDVELDYWPQSAHALVLRWEEGGPDPAIASGIVSCFSGGGGGSQPALFRKDLVPILDAAGERWRRADERRKGRAGGSLVSRLHAYFAEVQRGFETLVEPPHHELFVASAVGVLFEEGAFAIGTCGLERAYRVRAGQVELVARGRSMLDAVSEADRAKCEPSVLELYATMADGCFGGKRDAPTARWQTASLAVEEGDSVVLVAGASTIAEHVLENAILRTIAPSSSPKHARAIGEWLANPSSWADPPTGMDATKVRWTAISRVAIAVVRLPGRAEGAAPAPD